MLCRALFAAVVVSYVLCVLLLSGMHKEDLDADTLRKLQRHNVNIADIDDQKIREQCFVDNTLNVFKTANLEERKNSSSPPIAFVDENGATTALLRKMIEFFEKQNRNVTESTTKSDVVQGDAADINSLVLIIKNITKHLSASPTEKHADSRRNVTNEDSADTLLPKPFDNFKKQTENKKEATLQKNVIQNGHIDLDALISSVKNHNIEVKAVTPVTEVSQESRATVATKDSAKAQLQKFLDYFNKQNKNNRDATSKDFVIERETTTKTYVEDAATLTLTTHDMEDIADSVTNKPLKAVAVNDGQSIIITKKDNKNQKLLNTDKTQEERHFLQDKPHVLKDYEYISNIVAQILSQRQQTETQTTPSYFEKKRVQDIDASADNMSNRKITSMNKYIDNYNFTDKLYTNEPKCDRDKNAIISALLTQLSQRTSDKLPSRYKEETFSKYNQYIKDSFNLNDLKNNGEDDTKGAMYNYRIIPKQDIIGILTNKAAIDKHYKSKQRHDGDNWNSKPTANNLEEQRKLLNPLIERDTPNIHKTLNDNSPEVNKHSERNWFYFPEERGKKRKPTLEMEQKTSFLPGRYKTMNNENDSSLDNAYKLKWPYFYENQKIKEINPSSYQKRAPDIEFKSFPNTINKKDFPSMERKIKTAWPVFYEDTRSNRNLQLQNRNVLVNKPNELKVPENIQGRISKNHGSYLLEPVFTRWDKSKWPYLQRGIVSKKEVKSAEELRNVPQYFTNRKIVDQNNYDMQINNDNELLENTTTNDDFQKYVKEEKAKINKKKNDDEKDLNLTKLNLKEIADTVKAIVLEDLKKEKSTTNLPSTSETSRTTSGTNATTTVAAITSTGSPLTPQNDQVKIQEATKALEGLMKLFENFKHLKSQLDSVTNQNLNMAQKPNEPIIIGSTPRLPPRDYEVIQPHPKKDIILDPFTDKVHWEKMQIAPTKRAPAMTIQTNSNEIPPLRLTMARPLLVNTIIITTKPPPSLYEVISLQGNKGNSGTRSKSKQSYYRDHSRFKYEDKSIPRHIGKEYFHNIERFHEKLERGDERSLKAENSCVGKRNCSVKISERRQRPLSPRSRYDDKHFKNFLKTQEKVNAMLERILATKAKHDTPISAEVI